MPAEAIERTEWDDRLSAQYQKSLLHLSVVFALFSAVAAAKGAVFFFLLGNIDELARLFLFSAHDAGRVFLHYLFLPEYFSFLRPAVYAAQDYAQLGLACVLITGVVAVFALFERRFFANHLEEASTAELVHLFTLEAGGLRDVEEALRAVELFRLVCGGEDAVFNHSLVFDTAFVRREREARARPTAASSPARPEAESPPAAQRPSRRETLLAHIERSDRVFPRGGDRGAEERALVAAEPGSPRESFHHSLNDHFLGRVFVTFRDYASVRELLGLHAADKLRQAAEELLEGRFDGEELREVQRELLREALDEEQGWLARLKLAPARHLHDFIWEAARAPTPRARLKHAILFALLGLCFAALVVLVQYYDVYIFFQLVLHPERGATLWGYRFTPEMLVFKLCLVLIPEICQIILDIFLNEVQQRHYSSASNARFYVKIAAEVLLVFVASFYGYYIAVVLIRRSLRQEALFNAFYQSTLEWNIKAVLLLGKVLLRYAIDFARKLLARFRARRSGNPLDYTFDNAISSSMVVMVFLHAGFYLNGLSPCALALLTACLFCNWAGDRLFKADKAVIRDYISHHNVSLLIVSSGIVFVAGGVSALHMQFYFTPAVFFADRPVVVFPMFFVFSLCALGVMVPLLTHMARHKEVSARLLEFLVHNSPAQELDEHPKKDFRSANPFYAEVFEPSPYAKEMLL